MDVFFSHDAAFSHLVPAGFKLRLDQDRHRTILLQDGSYRRNDLQNGYERYICRNEIDLFSQHLFCHDFDVRLFHIDDQRMRAELPVELIGPDIDSKDLRRTILQCTVGEAAGRGTDVRHDLSLHVL